MRILRHVSGVRASLLYHFVEDLSYHLICRVVTCLDVFSSDSIVGTCFAFLEFVDLLSVPLLQQSRVFLLFLLQDSLGLATFHFSKNCFSFVVFDLWNECSSLRRFNARYVFDASELVKNPLYLFLPFDLLLFLMHFLICLLTSFKCRFPPLAILLLSSTSFLIVSSSFALSSPFFKNSLLLLLLWRLRPDPACTLLHPSHSRCLPTARHSHVARSSDFRLHCRRSIS